MYYILNDLGEPVEEPDRQKWLAWHRDDNPDRIVGQEAWLNGQPVPPLTWLQTRNRPARGDTVMIRTFFSGMDEAAIRRASLNIPAPPTFGHRHSRSLWATEIVGGWWKSWRSPSQTYRLAWLRHVEQAPEVRTSVSMAVMVMVLGTRMPLAVFEAEVVAWADVQSRGAVVPFRGRPMLGFERREDAAMFRLSPLWQDDMLFITPGEVALGSPV